MLEKIIKFVLIFFGIYFGVWCLQLLFIKNEIATIIAMWIVGLCILMDVFFK